MKRFGHVDLGTCNVSLVRHVVREAMAAGCFVPPELAVFGRKLSDTGERFGFGEGSPS